MEKSQRLWLKSWTPSGKTPAQLARDIEKVLAEYIKEPIETVMVRRIHRAIQRANSIIGEATSSYPYREDMTLLDVMMIAVGVLLILRLVIKRLSCVWWVTSRRNIESN